MPKDEMYRTMTGQMSIKFETYSAVSLKTSGFNAG
jgi:hypothetical protein